MLLTRQGDAPGAHPHCRHASRADRQSPWARVTYEDMRERCAYEKSKDPIRHDSALSLS
ncbi:protein of unknown function [Azospirillum baldaniorum]|uniref:Uncharacterized protein n=1 Tax=Azospirillum baldaniorum TaxID=1064539 RepID=A0A9P1JTG7_9PROT|nr:protein of unknown function [Azospirillum baldaniorum]